MKMIRLAVIGTTSSGKTYLLRDMISSFERLGYSCTQKLGSWYQNPFDFCLKVDEQDGLDKTRLASAPCRRYNEYRGTFVNRNNRREFNIGFLDIPGEIYEAPRIGRFIRIISELYRIGRCFTFDVYKNANQTSKVLRFVGNDGNAEPSSEYETIIKDVYLDRGYEINERIPKCLRKVSGKQLIAHFFDYDTDSVLEAITQAIPYFSPNAGITQKEFIQDNVGKELFYYFYTLYATDVILCDKLVMPVGVTGEISAICSPVVQMKGLYNIDEFKPCAKKYYMAFRGADALLNNCVGDLKNRNMKTNDIYALMVFLLEYKLEGRNRCPVTELDQYLGDEVCKYIKERTLPICAQKYLADEFTVQPYYNQGREWQYSHGEDLTTALNQRMQTAINDFMSLRADERHDKDIFMAPNVFLTSSAIANEMFNYEVTGNSLENVRRMEGCCEYPANRDCFGTLQLAKSLLTRNNIGYEADLQGISLIEDYIQ